MFEYMKEHRIILVTGPQRSGTTICARMIAHDTNYTYVDEARFGIHNAIKAMNEAERYKRSVIQGPGLLINARLFGQRDDCAVVLVQRKHADIVQSILRRDPSKWQQELKLYPMSSIRLEDFPAVIYGYWWDVVEPLVKHPYYITYESLSDHPLWVPKEKRVGWKVRQWKV